MSTFLIWQTLVNTTQLARFLILFLVGKFNIENQTYQLDNHRWNQLNSDQKASLDLQTHSVDLEAMTVIDRTTEKEIILNQNCNKCLLMIKINRFNLFDISPFFKKYSKNFQNDHLGMFSIMSAPF